MRSILLILLVPALLSCASTNPPAASPSPDRLPLPAAVTSPPSASTEGALLQSLTGSLIALRNELTQFLQMSFDLNKTDLLESLERARVSPPPTGAAGSSR